jgi:hypothetical protein
MIEELKEERKRYAQAIQKALQGLLIPDLQDIVIQYWKPVYCPKLFRVTEWVQMERGEHQTRSVIIHFNFADLPDQLTELNINDDVECAVEVQFGMATIITQGHRLDFPVVWEDIIKKDDGTTN